jgi:hypothetical protein
MVDTHPADPSKQIHGSTKTCLSMSGGFFVEVGLRTEKAGWTTKIVLQARCFVNLLLNIHKNFRFGCHFSVIDMDLLATINQLWSFKDIVVGMILGTLWIKNLCWKEIISQAAWFFFQFCNIENMACLSKKWAK